MVWALIGAPPTQAQRAPEVAIVSPEPGTVALGTVQLELRVWGDAESVEVFLDGQSLGVLRTPPWQMHVEVGASGREHVFEAVARAADGRQDTARVRTGSFRVDEVVDLEVIELYVTATQGGRRVEDLLREDFVVEDDGVEQAIANFYRGDAPLTAWLLIDTSGSMQGDRLRAAIAGADEFLDGLEDQDRARLTLFSDRVQSVSPMTSFVDVLRLGLDRAVARGATAINDHLFLALQQLAGLQGRRTIILLSDGIDTVSILGMDDVLPLARRSGALIYWIRPERRGPELSSSWRDGNDLEHERRLLEQVVRESGGRIVEVPSLAESRGGFREILDEMRDQYVLGFYPTENRNDGSWHRVRVEVRRNDLEIRTRSGYLDAVPAPDAP